MFPNVAYRATVYRTGVLAGVDKNTSSEMISTHYIVLYTLDHKKVEKSEQELGFFLVHSLVTQHVILDESI